MTTSSALSCCSSSSGDTVLGTAFERWPKQCPFLLGNLHPELCTSVVKVSHLGHERLSILSFDDRFCNGLAVWLLAVVTALSFTTRPSLVVVLIVMNAYANENGYMCVCVCMYGVLVWWWWADSNDVDDDPLTLCALLTRNCALLRTLSSSTRKALWAKL